MHEKQIKNCKRENYDLLYDRIYEIVYDINFLKTSIHIHSKSFIGLHSSLHSQSSIKSCLRERFKSAILC